MLISRNTVEQVLNLCCSLYLLNNTRNTINSNNNDVSTKLNQNNHSYCKRSIFQQQEQSIFNNFANNITNTDDCIPKVSSCCLLDWVETKYDVFTNQPHLIYKAKPNLGLQQLKNVKSGGGRRCAKKNSNHYYSGQITNVNITADVELPDFSQFPFIELIWYVREPWEIAIKTSATLPIVVFAIIGNIIIIRIIIKSKLTKNSVNLFILNMSIADLLTSATFSWILLIQDFYQRFVLGKIICKIHGSIIITLMLTSVLSLTVISFDRILAIVFPFKKRMNAKVAKYVIYAIWLISIGVSVPTIFWREFIERQWLDFFEFFCNEARTRQVELYWLCVITILVWIPIGALIVSYTAIIIKLNYLERRQGGKGEQQQQQQPSLTKIKFKAKVVRMFLFVLIAFIICWVPFTILIFMRNVLPRYRNSVTVQIENLLFASQYLILVNSAVNPLIYGFKNENIKRGFREALPSCLKRQIRMEVSTVMGQNNGGTGKNNNNNGNPAFNNNNNNNNNNLLQNKTNTTGLTGGGGGGATTKNINLNQHDDDLGKTTNPYVVQLNKKHKYYDNLLFSNPGEEMASCNSYERIDSALADLGLPIPSLSPIANNDVINNNLDTTSTIITEN